MKQSKLIIAVASVGLIAASGVAAVSTETDYDRQDNSVRAQPWERAVQDADGNPKGPQSLFQEGQIPPTEVDASAIGASTADGANPNVEDMIANSSTIAGIEGDIASNSTRINENTVLINENRVLTESEMQALQDRLADLENGSAGGGASQDIVTVFMGDYSTLYRGFDVESYVMTYEVRNNGVRADNQVRSDVRIYPCSVFAIYERSAVDGSLTYLETTTIPQSKAFLAVLRNSEEAYIQVEERQNISQDSSLFYNRTFDNPPVFRNFDTVDNVLHRHLRNPKSSPILVRDRNGEFVSVNATDWLAKPFAGDGNVPAIDCPADPSQGILGQ